MTGVTKSTGYTPTGSRVLIEVRTPTPSPSLIISSNAPQETQGIVRCVGPKVRDLHRGDSVYFDKMCGTELTINGRLHKVMREFEVLAVVERV